MYTIKQGDTYISDEMLKGLYEVEIFSHLSDLPPFIAVITHALKK
jgi:hypothetical protein